MPAVGMRTALHHRDPPRDGYSQCKCCREEEPVVAVKFHLREQIGRRNAEEGACRQRQSDAEQGAAVAAEELQAEEECKRPQRHHQRVDRVDQAPRLGRGPRLDHQRGDDAGIERLVEHDRQKRRKSREQSAAVGIHRGGQSGAVGEAVQGQA